MKLKIVYDSEAEPGFKRGWGFSCLIELKDEKILFDTGWDGNVLLSNLRKLGVRPDEIKSVVISHAHWDHIGGLPWLGGRDMQAYVLKSLSRRLREELALRFELYEIKDAQQISDGVWTTGTLGKRIKEQSLVLKTGGGLVVVVGCSHPGVRNILSVAAKFGKIFGVVGGMHDFKDYGALKGLKLIAPLHCTANKRKIAELFPDAYVEGKAGLGIVI
jgi:7,8-dihydropterin-6-yl-methyl-4-(beta-D-ribofuranosyl)aminobenzene 5'-phosphate synthase